MARSEELQRLLAQYGIETCGDNSCIFGSNGGMATNGGCRCVTCRSCRKAAGWPEFTKDPAP